MRALAAMLAIVPALAAAGGVRPTKYVLTFEPDLAKGTFSGEVTLSLQVQSATSAIGLHAVDLDVTADAGSVTYAGEIATLHLRELLMPGPAALTLRFSGKLGEKLRGWYLARSGQERFAVTQLEVADARRMFPCFDEPVYKATFQINVIVPRGMTAISNGAIARQKPLPGGKTRVEFAETAPISTYLVALAVGPFKGTRTVMAGKVPIRAWTARGKEKLADFALQSAAAALPRLEAFFGAPYPFGKLDLVAAPEFEASAMENAGAIFFAEDSLLLDARSSSVDARRWVAEVMTHELAHQWFGDLVTMVWWDDLWLNEAFATWMQVKIDHALHPEWNEWRGFVVDSERAMHLDALTTSHPVRAEVATPDDAEANFDSITYYKGAAVIRMIERWLGAGAFQRGIQRYIAKHRFGNARAEDLWSALEDASSQPVLALAKSWLEQPGMPLLGVSARCEGGRTRVALEQRRFLASGDADTSGALWSVPACFRTPAGEHCAVLGEARGQVDLPGPCAAWVLANAGAAGFHRTRYDDAGLAALGAARAALLPEERVGLLADQWALVRAGLMPAGSFLSLLGSFSGERDADVLKTAYTALDFFDRYLIDGAARHRFASLVEDLYRPGLVELGWSAARGESDETKRVRALAVAALGNLARDEKVIAAARARLDAHLSGASALDPTLLDEVMILAARSGDAALFQRLEARAFAARGTPEDRERSLGALAEFEDPALFRRALDLTLSDRIRAQDVRTLFGPALNNRAGRGAAWKFLTANWDAIAARASPDVQSYLAAKTRQLCTEEEQAAVTRFFAAHPIESGARDVASAAESIGLCSAIKKRTAPELSRWLAAPIR